jgi:hypothetical protein
MVIVKQVVTRPPVHTQTGATLIDVAGTASPQTIISLVKLNPGERVATIDDTRVDNDLIAGIAIAERAHARDSFVDLGVVGPLGPRRVLLLFH